MNSNYTEVRNKIEFTPDAINFLRELIGAHGARIMRQCYHHRRLMSGENKAYHERMLRYYKDSWSYLKYMLSQASVKWNRHELVAGGMMVGHIIEAVIPHIDNEITLTPDIIIGEEDEI